MINKQLIETVKKHANQTNSPVLYYLVYLRYRDVEYLFKAAELNCLPAIQDIYRKSEDPNEKLKWLLKGSELGDVNSRIDLCKYYVERGDDSNAMKWFLLAKACKGKEVIYDYAYELGHDFYEKEEIEKAMEWFSISAERGYPNSQNNLSVCYTEKQDHTNAFKWCLKAAESGYSTNQYHVASLYETAEKDLTKAFEWYLKSAEQGEIDAILRVAHYYEQGLGPIKKDNIKAVEWFLKAPNSSEAQFKLGCFFDGIQDFNKSFEWFLEAAENNNKDAQYQIAYMYCNGIGIEPNMNESWKWLIRIENNVISQFFHFMRSCKLLNHLPQRFFHFSGSEEMSIDPDLKSNRKCGICLKKCRGYYYSTGNDYHSFDVCMKCWIKDDINERLTEFKSKIREKTFFKNHFLKGFLPLVEFFKQENQIDNPKLDAIILELKQI